MVAKHTDEEEARWQAGVAMMREEQRPSAQRERRRRAKQIEAGILTAMRGVHIESL